LRTISLILLLLFLLVGSMVPPYDPNAIDFTAINSGPTALHWFGTDGLGRDLLSRLMVAAPISLAAPIVVAIVGISLGTTVALLTMWSKGGILDRATSRVSDIFIAFPAILIAILVVAMFGKGLVPVIASLAVAYAPYAYRLVRTEVMVIRNSGYIRSLEIQGMSKAILTKKHVLPNISGLLWAQTTIFIGYALVDVAALSFLGLGTQPPSADWGSMVASGLSSAVSGDPWESLTASLAIFVVIICAVLTGDRVEAQANRRRMS
jgi:peptide/nickel transport system permease protein